MTNREDTSLRTTWVSIVPVARLDKTHDLSKETLGSHISTMSNSQGSGIRDQVSEGYLPVAGSKIGSLISSRTPLVEVNGIEPMTSCLQSTRSTN